MDKRVNSIPATLARYRVPRTVLTASADALRNQGAGMREAVILWQGRVLSEAEAEVTKLIVPTQNAGALHFDIPLAERLRILREVTAAREFVLIQLHTHPNEAFHSKADDQLAITKHVGAISIVIPDFGLRWNGEFVQTSVHRHLGAARWRKLSDTEINQLFGVVP